MNHESMKELIFALYDGESSPSDREKALAHMRTCVECRQIAQRWETMGKRLFRVPPPPVPETFVQSVMDKIQDQEELQTGETWWPAARWLIPALGFGLAALLFSLAPIPQDPFIHRNSPFGR